MKKLLSLFFAVAMATLLALPTAAACDGDAKKEEPKNQAPAAQLKTASFKVNGMHCQGCGDKIRAALAKTEGVHKVDVKSADKRVVVDYDAKKLSPEKIAKIISDLGYPANAEA
jgi:copper chaperone CopZ